MRREQVVGKRITRLMRDEVEVVCGEPPIPGISDGVLRFFHVFLELDGRDLMEVGLDSRYYPLMFVSNEIRERLTDVPLSQSIRECIGTVIADVVTLHHQIMFRLSSGSYFSVEDDFQGTEVCLTQPEDIPVKALVDYWKPL